LTGIGVVVLPGDIAVPRAFEAFDEHGNLKDANQQAKIQGLGATLAQTLTKLSS
jgi:hypothetical protein